MKNTRIMELGISRALMHADTDVQSALDLVRNIVLNENLAEQNLLLQEICPLIVRSGYNWLLNIIDECEDDRDRFEILLFMKNRLIPYLHEYGLGLTPLQLFTDELDFDILKILLAPDDFGADCTLRDFKRDPAEIFKGFTTEARQVATTYNMSGNEAFLLRVRSAIVFGYYARLSRFALEGDVEAAEKSFRDLGPNAVRILDFGDFYGVLYAYMNALMEMSQLYLDTGSRELAQETVDVFETVISKYGKYFSPETRESLLANAQRIIESEEEEE